MTAILFAIGDIKVTVYALFCVIALAAFVGISVYMSRYYRSLKTGDILGYFRLCFPIALALSRALYCAVNYDEQSFWGAFALWRGGFAMTGALLGACLAACIYARLHRKKTGYMLDCVTPGMLIFVFIMRAAERFTGQGLGKTITTPFMTRGIFAYMDIYGEARHCVWRYEALSALFTLIVFAYCFTRLRRRRERAAGGESFRVAAIIWSMSQVVLESMRDDRYLHIDFFRIQQIVAMLMFVSVIAWYYRKLWAARGNRRERWALLGATAACLALTVNQEFAVDRDRNLEFNYLIMYLSLTGAAVCALRARHIYRRGLRDAKGAK